jgi:hypothetical protein
MEGKGIGARGLSVLRTAGETEDNKICEIGFGWTWKTQGFSF